MCRFYSGWARKNADGSIEFIDQFPYESHSGVDATKRENAVPIECIPLATGLEFVDHSLPEWWTDETTSALSSRIEKLQAEIAKQNKVEAAKKARAQMAYQLRKMCKDKARRKIIIERCGHGSLETAMRHMAHIRSERSARRSFSDELEIINRKVTVAWLASLTDEKILSRLNSAQRRCSARTLSLSQIKGAIARYTETGQPQVLCGGGVSKAYYKVGYAPTTTRARIGNGRNPLQIYRDAVRWND